MGKKWGKWFLSGFCGDSEGSEFRKQFYFTVKWKLFEREGNDGRKYKARCWDYRIQVLLIPNMDFFVQNYI